MKDQPENNATPLGWGNRSKDATIPAPIPSLNAQVGILSQ